MRTNELRVIKYRIPYYEYTGTDLKTKKNQYGTVKYMMGSIRNRNSKYRDENGKLNYDTEIAMFSDTKIIEKSKVLYNDIEYEIKLLYREPNELGNVYFYYLKVL